jgi:hypothetical protein
MDSAVALRKCKAVAVQSRHYESKVAGRLRRAKQVKTSKQFMPVKSIGFGGLRVYARPNILYQPMLLHHYFDSSYGP